MKYLQLTFLLIILSTSISFAQSNSLGIDRNYDFRAVAEIGFLGVADHKVQFGQNGTYFDYRKDGGQNVLFPVSRLSLELDFKERNTLTFLYQPLSIETQAVLSDDLIIDDLTYPAGSSVDLLYNFPFYRLSYLRHLRTKSDKLSLAFGASIQIRNATINFQSGDGTLLKTNRDVGIVPLLKFKGDYKQSQNLSLEVEIDGIYAPISYLNGSSSDVIGALLDASIRQNIRLTEGVNTFLNLRYLGGGAEGTSNDTSDVSDGFTKNWLHFYTVSIGFVYAF